MKKNSYSTLLLVVCLFVAAYFLKGNNQSRSQEPVETSQGTGTTPSEGQEQVSTSTEEGEAADASSTDNESPDLDGIARSGNTAHQQMLYRLAYICAFNTTNKIPDWVGWCLTAQHTSGPYKRNGIPFHEDDEVANSPTTYDYVRSGYDRGHMCPSGDNKWSETAQQQSFLMTNICPQTHSLNAGDWNELEQKCRKWANIYGKLYIVCGPILYRSAHSHIGNGVTVPEAFFKVVLRTSPDTAAIGFIYRNADGNRPMGDYINSVDEVERITNINFFTFLPKATEAKVERRCSLNNWQQ